jgi:hypothetical protein
MDANVSINCKYCDKKYTHRSSLSRHIKMKHANFDKKSSKKISFDGQNISKKISFDGQNISKKISFDGQNISKKISSNEIDNIISCKFCKKEFKFKSNKYRHEKKCKIDRPSYDEIKDQLDNVRDQLLHLMNKKCKIICVKKNN